jgi:hypothetical protein
VIAALYVEKHGIYSGLPDVDVWDVERDARGYAGPYSVVAHPPCDRWHLLSAVNHKRWGYQINEDGGCFAAALASVRRWGGVLEHPAETRAFRFHGIPEPAPGHWQRTIDGDWVVEVNQAAYGHRARKRTWLLTHGVSADDLSYIDLDYADAQGTHRVGFGFPADTDKPLPRISKQEASATPIAFRDLLLGIARLARQAPKCERALIEAGSTPAAAAKNSDGVEQ